MKPPREAGRLWQWQGQSKEREEGTKESFLSREEGSKDVVPEPFLTRTTLTTLGQAHLGPNPSPQMKWFLLLVVEGGLETCLSARKDQDGLPFRGIQRGLARGQAPREGRQGNSFFL